MKSAEELNGVVADLRRDHRQTILLEEYVAGEELTVGVYGNERPTVLGIMRVVPHRPSEHFIYSLEVKRHYQHHVSYECPARLSEVDKSNLERAALTAYRALGCRDIARVDFRLKAGVPYFLEVNPLPGLNPIDSDLVLLAQGVGWSYEQLIRTIFDMALARYSSVRSIKAII